MVVSDSLTQSIVAMFLDTLCNSSFIQLLVVVAFEYVNTDVFDLLLSLAVEYLHECDMEKRVPQFITQCMTMEMILNNLKTTKGTQVDRRVLFLRFINELVKDPVVASSFYESRGIELLIHMNESTGSISIRNHSLIILRQLTSSHNPRTVYSSYHAVFQIFQKEMRVIMEFVSLLNERLSLCRDWVCR